MGTFVSIDVVQTTAAAAEDAKAAVDRAFGWFHRVEAACTRFDPASELMQLAARIGEPVPVGPMLFDAVRFALAVAKESGGAFDPTLGAMMETRGFNREHRTRRLVRTELPPEPPQRHRASWRDVVLDPDRRTITVTRPLVLDLGAVAKGLAVDLAAKELQPFVHFAIDAGGDLYFSGLNPRGEKWAVGVRHPRRDGEVIDVLHVSDAAVCTSGDYERSSPAADGGHHLLDPRTGTSATAVASVTVVAPTAMAADAIATAAFVLGPAEGLAFLERQGVDGLIVTPALESLSTPGLSAWRAPAGPDRVRAATA
jgi:thiamine biosynthesis lipoprotein